MSRSTLAACLVVGALLSAGCASPSGTATSARPTPETTTTAVDPAQAIAKRCGQPDAPSTRVTVSVGKEQLNVASVGAGSVVAIYLHQTDGDGLCGFWPYANAVAPQGIRSLLVDLCSYGESMCGAELSGEPTRQVKAVVDWARANGGKRITLVGASMGGSIALGTAGGVGADAVIDLSGPAKWSGVPDAGPAAKAISVPLLILAADNDRDTDAKALRAALAGSPAKVKRFVSPPNGHGWDLILDWENGSYKVSDNGALVANWITGKYPAQ